jgi:hypothetical protein
MITIFNRKEVFTGYLDGLNKSRDALDAQGIKYSYKTSTSVLSSDLRSSYMYYLYVHKKDYDLASHVLGRGQIR